MGSGVTGFNLGCVSPKFSEPYRRNYTFWRCKIGTNLLYNYTMFGRGGAWTSQAAEEGRKTWVFVFCLSVTLFSSQVCECDLALSHLNLETILISLDRGKFLLAYPCSTICKPPGGATTD